MRATRRRRMRRLGYPGAFYGDLYIRSMYRSPSAWAGAKRRRELVHGPTNRFWASSTIAFAVIAGAGQPARVCARPLHWHGQPRSGSGRPPQGDGLSPSCQWPASDEPARATIASVARSRSGSVLARSASPRGLVDGIPRSPCIRSGRPGSDVPRHRLSRRQPDSRCKGRQIVSETKRNSSRPRQPGMPRPRGDARPAPPNTQSARVSLELVDPAAVAGDHFDDDREETG